MIVDYFHTADVHTMMYSYENLHELKWKGDNKVPEFMDAWVEIVDNLVVELTDENLRDMLHKKMIEGETKLFTLDLHLFQRQKDLSIETKVQQPDYTLDYLWRTMNRHIAREKEEKMVAQRKNMHVNGKEEAVRILPPQLLLKSKPKRAKEMVKQEVEKVEENLASPENPRLSRRQSLVRAMAPRGKPQLQLQLKPRASAGSTKPNCTGFMRKDANMIRS